MADLCVFSTCCSSWVYKNTQRRSLLWVKHSEGLNCCLCLYWGEGILWNQDSVLSRRSLQQAYRPPHTTDSWLERLSKIRPVFMAQCTSSPSGPLRKLGYWVSDTVDTENNTKLSLAVGLFIAWPQDLFSLQPSCPAASLCRLNWMGPSQSKLSEHLDKQLVQYRVLRISQRYKL